MTLDAALALALFAFVSSVTPGPNNLMLLASGVNFGLRRTVPHLLGISLGFMLMITLMGLGFSELFKHYPWLHNVLKWCGAAYMLQISWKIAHAAPPSSSTKQNNTQPMTFIGASLFQWVNPKAWAMALSAIVTYVPQVQGRTSMLHLTMVVAIFGPINLCSVSLWAAAGAHLRSWLAVDRQRRAFNYVMALLLVLSLLPIIWA
jgi:threonine/homoserine/homoserine lactone efflux protein